MDTQTHTTEESSKPPLWKQLLGAAGGALVALGMYTVYSETSPQVTAWLSIPWPNDHRAPSGKVNVLDVDDYDAQNRIAAKAREIADRFSTRPVHTVDGEEEDGESRELAQTETSNAVPDPPSYQSIIEKAQVSVSSSSQSSSSSAPSDAPVSVSSVAVPSEDMSGVGGMVEENEGSSSVARIANVPELPSSGIGIWLIGIAAFLAAVGFRFRKQLQEEIVRFQL